MPPAPVRLADRAVAIIAMAAVVVLCLAVLAGVVSRGVGEPVIWSDEASRFVMVWLACLGWILAGRKRAHIRVRFFLDRIPEPVHGWLEAAMQAAVCLFGMLTAWYGVELVHRNREIEATTLPLAMAWMYVPVVLAGVATALQGAVETVASLRRRGGEGAA
jgi:TRAP-type transport system small permease protein